MSGGSVTCVALARASTTSVSTLLFLRGVALHRLDQVGNEVGAALILVQHLAPGGLGLLLQGWDGVDAAAGKRQPSDRQSQRTDEDARTRTRQCQHDSLPEQPKTASATGVLAGRSGSKGFCRCGPPPSCYRKVVLQYRDGAGAGSNCCQNGTRAKFIRNRQSRRVPLTGAAAGFSSKMQRVVPGPGENARGSVNSLTDGPKC